MSDDLISRADAIEEVCKMMAECFDADEEVIDAIETTIKEISPTHTKQEWIPCEERLPRADDCRNCEYHKCTADEPQTDYDKGLQLLADILFDKEKCEQFLKECKAMGIEPQTDCAWMKGE